MDSTDRSQDAEMEFRRRVGDRLRKARQARGLSLQAVADHFSLSKATIGHWETGKNPPDLGTLFRLSRHYHCPLSQLLQEPLDAEQLLDMLRQAVLQQAAPSVANESPAPRKRYRAAA